MIIDLLRGRTGAPDRLTAVRDVGDDAHVCRTLTQADSLIAAAALSIGARFATGNPKDFPMKELRVEHWPAGS